MEQVVGGIDVKSRSTRTVIAGVFFALFLAAFAAAFYYLGGAQVVADLFAGAPAGSPAPTQQPAAAAPVPSTSATPSAETTTAAEATSSALPAGIEDAFAKRMYVEQLDSQENIGRLIRGEVKEMTFGKATAVADGTEVAARVALKNGTAMGGVIGLSKQDAGSFFTYTNITGGGDNNESDRQPEIGRRTVDQDVVRTILEQQLKSQEIITRIADGTYTKVVCDGVKTDVGTATLDVTFSGPRGGAVKGRVLCIEKAIDGQDTWFITSFSKV